jgi:hypothetical protein
MTVKLLVIKVTIRIYYEGEKMGNLISRNALLKACEEAKWWWIYPSDVLSIIEEQPTVYDVDKTLEEIENLPHGEYKDDYGKGFSAGVKACLKFVKGGLEE